MLGYTGWMIAKGYFTDMHIIVSFILQMPSLRYNLTVEDYARDREAESERVQQMLQEVEDAHKAKQGRNQGCRPTKEMV